MTSSEATETKTIITSLLISTPLKCTVQQLCKDFLNTVGYKIPFQRLGFNSVEEYLHSIPDTVRIHGSGLLAQVEAVIKPKSAHINELVVKQKKTAIPSHKKRYIKQFHNVHQPSTSNNHYAASYPRRPQTGPHQNYNSQYKSTTNTFKQHSIKPSVNGESCESQPNYSPEELRPSSSLSSSSYKEKHEENDKKQEKDADSVVLSDFDDYETRVPPTIQNNLKKLILKFPNGLESARIPAEYQKMFGKKLSYEKFSYRSVIEMCSDLPEIFHYVKCNDEYYVYDKNRPVPCLDQNEKRNETDGLQLNETIGGDIFSEIPKFDWTTGLKFIPTDVLHLSDRIPRYFPNDLEVGDYIDISVGEIYDISKFWVYLTFGDLNKLMAELQDFFNNQRNKYLIPEFLLSEGLYCTTLYAGQYHRSVIVDLMPKLPNTVRVLYVDYGTVGNVSSKEIWYLPKQFGKVPCQAIRTRLSNIYPVYENRTWSVQAVNRFKKLVTSTALVGEITRIDEDDHVLEIYLADITDQNKIFYINDLLVEEGHALHVGQEQKESLMDPNCRPVVKYIHLYPEFSEIESGMAPTSSEMNYLVTNKVPLHHFMPHYFEIYYDEDIEHIERHHEMVNKDPSTPKIKQLDSSKFDYSKDFDFSFFPDGLRGEIEDLVKEEVAKANAEQSTVPKVEDTSVKEYSCNKKRMLELRSGGSEKNDTFSDLSSSLEMSLQDIVPLNNTLQNLNLNSSDLPVINNVSKPSNCTNPFLSEEHLAEPNPFRRTNPFLSDLEEAANNKDLFEMYAKPLENKENNLKTSNQSPSKVNKEANVGHTGTLNSPTHAEIRPQHSNTHNTRIRPQPSGQGVRPPPGFNCGNVPPLWQQDVIHPAYFNSNPYYQRFPQFGNLLNFTVNQTGMGLMPNFVPPFYPNPLNLEYLQQLARNFGAQSPLTSPGGNAMNFQPMFKK